MRVWEGPFISVSIRTCTIELCVFTRTSCNLDSILCLLLLPLFSMGVHRTSVGSLRTTTLATSNSSSSMNAASPSGPKASGMAVASAE